MVGGQRRLNLRARAALLCVAGVGLGSVGLIGGGAKPAAPFVGKSVSTVAGDRFSTAVTDSGGNNLEVVALGPGNRLYYYWQVNGKWYGPLQIGGAGTAYSGPAIEDERGNVDNLDVAVEGPNHSLNFFWNIAATNTWYGPLQIGAPGSAYSAPAVTVDSNGDVDVAVQGPNGSLFFYWSIGGIWYGPLQVAGTGTTLSAPSTAQDSLGDCGGTTNTACVGVAVKGPFNQAVVYWERGGKWLAPVTSGTGLEYSSPTTANTNGHWGTAYVGPSNSLIGQIGTSQGGTNSYCVIGAAGTAYAAPTSSLPFFAQSNAAHGPTTFNYAVQGPANSLYAFWAVPSHSPPTSCAHYAFYGPLQVSGASTVASVPSLDTVNDTVGNLNVNVLIEGPAHTLWVFYNVAGSWYGPLQIGAPGTTYDSNS